MAVVENTYALTRLARVKNHLGIAAAEAKYDVELVQAINEASAQIESYAGRYFRSRTWTHDGTTLPRLSSTGGTRLWLPAYPITSVTSLKLEPTGSAMTAWNGTSGDYAVRALEGIIELVSGWSFWDAPNVVELTYVGGFLDSPTAAQASFYGWTSAAADVEAAAVQQVAWFWSSKDRHREGVTSRSFEGVTTAFMTDALLPEVKEKLERYRRVLPAW